MSTYNFSRFKPAAANGDGHSHDKKDCVLHCIPSSLSIIVQGMRVFDEVSAQKFLVGDDPDLACVLLVKSQGVESFHDEAILLRNTCILGFPHNRLLSNQISTIWKKFPSAWWVDLSHNNVKGLESGFPMALGALNLAGNDVKNSDLSHLIEVHILRLKVTVGNDVTLGAHPTINALIANFLPNVWVVNDDFITESDRKTGAGSAADADLVVCKKETEFVNKYGNERSMKLVRAVQNCPKGKFSEYFRLEVLLEEYLQEACYFNCFVQQMTLQNNSSHRHVELMPFVDIYALMMLPHRLRLDLTVVLTTTLMLHVPKNLLREALLLLMGQYLSTDDIDQLYNLPTFVKTALVCLLRRVSKKEHLEYETIKQYCPKPERFLTFAQQKSLYANANKAPPPLDYLSTSGFQFLRPMKAYFDQPIEALSEDPVVLRGVVPFSELELEIISKLPDVPTVSSAADYFKEQSLGQENGRRVGYQEWIPFAARHTVLLLTKAPSCPPLTRPQQSKAKQELYFEMLPLLQAAHMTFSDLDLGFTGPGKDGRMLKPKITASMGGNYLPFGTGLPSACPDLSLSWKVNEVARNYLKPWAQGQPKAEKEPDDGQPSYSDDLESVHSRIFLTAEDTPKPPVMTMTNARATSYYSIEQYDFGAPAPMPRNQSVPILTNTVSKLMLNALGSDPAFNQRQQGTAPLSHAASVGLNLDVGENVDNYSNSITKSHSISLPTINPVALSGDPSVYDMAYSPSSLEGGDNDTDHVGLPMEGSELTSRFVSEANSEIFVLSPDSVKLGSPTDTARAFTPLTANTARSASRQTPTRPENVAGAMAHPILGFSADANWESKFLLAPPSKIAQSNHIVGDADPMNQWNFIEYAPVVVHSPSRRVAPEVLQSMSATGLGVTDAVRQLTARAFNSRGAPASAGRSSPLKFTDTITNEFSFEEEEKMQADVRQEWSTTSQARKYSFQGVPVSSSTAKSFVWNDRNESEFVFNTVIFACACSFVF